MKTLLQRVLRASVAVDGQLISEIGVGILAYVGLEKSDTSTTVERMVERLLNYRLFADANGKMNLCIREHGGGVLAVSQFTLAADTHKGNRPGFSSAMAPELAAVLFSDFMFRLEAAAKPAGVEVATGQFQAHMEISSINDGPVNFLLSI